jgi:hypothetical protein
MMRAGALGLLLGALAACGDSTESLSGNGGQGGEGGDGGGDGGASASSYGFDCCDTAPPGTYCNGPGVSATGYYCPTSGSGQPVQGVAASGGQGGSGGSTTTGEGGAGGMGDGVGGHGGGDGTCLIELVGDREECDSDCDAALSGEAATMCTVACDEPEDCPPAEDGQLECVTDGQTTVCAFTCSGGDVCPDGYVCDDSGVLGVCIPDVPPEP